MEQGQIKTLIGLSYTVENANNVIERYTECKTYAEKTAYVKELFEVEELPYRGENEQEEYIALLLEIIERKWDGIAKNE